MLTAAEIAAMRTTETQALPDSCTIMRKVSVADGRGGTTATWEVSESGIDCRLGRAGSRSGSETIDADKLQGKTPWVITFSYGDDVRDADRIVIGSRTFEVASVEYHAAWMMALRVQCIEVT